MFGFQKDCSRHLTTEQHVTTREAHHSETTMLQSKTDLLLFCLSALTLFLPLLLNARRKDLSIIDEKTPKATNSFPEDSQLEKYGKLIAQSPKYSLCALQKAIDREIESLRCHPHELILAKRLNQANEIGPSIVLLLNDERGKRVPLKVLLHILYLELSEEKVDALQKSFQDKEIFEHLTRLAESYQKYDSSDEGNRTFQKRDRSH
jgi:hypothetical protein